MVEVAMKRVRVFATIREDVEAWIQKQVETGKFRNRSHAMEYALLQLMKDQEENKGKIKLR
jgi:Arc/MetJ-type ribon-helix-helix transcriptional regulator